MCLLPWLISSLTLICGECRRWGKDREAIQERDRERGGGGKLGGKRVGEKSKKRGSRVNDH